MRFTTFFAAALSAVAVSAHFNETHHGNGTEHHPGDDSTTTPCTVTKTYTYVTETICPGGCEYPTGNPDGSYPNTTTTYVEPQPNYTGPSIPPPSEGGAVSNKVGYFGAALAGFVAVAAFAL